MIVSERGVSANGRRSPGRHEHVHRRGNAAEYITLTLKELALRRLAYGVIHPFCTQHVVAPAAAGQIYGDASLRRLVAKTWTESYVWQGSMQNVSVRDSGYTRLHGCGASQSLAFEGPCIPGDLRPM